MLAHHTPIYLFHTEKCVGNRTVDEDKNVLQKRQQEILSKIKPLTFYYSSGLQSNKGKTMTYV